jgi:hypothetical protein
LERLAFAFKFDFLYGKFSFTQKPRASFSLLLEKSLHTVLIPLANAVASTEFACSVWLPPLSFHSNALGDSMGAGL